MRLPRRRTSLRTLALTLAALTVGAGSAVLAPAGPATAADYPITLTGHGFGHGRGMGQWGALGYAVDSGWSTDQILDHFYGGTHAAAIGNPPISVELMGWRGRGILAYAPGITVNGSYTGSDFVYVSRSGPNTFVTRTGPSCGGPWSAPQPLAAGSVVVAAPAGEIETCDSSSFRGYRGDLQLVDRGTDSATVNRLPVESYLRGVVPRESPASWADLGGGRGAAALRAQAVAARSYVIAAPFATYATTCDTTTCQVYGGAWTRGFTTAGRTSLDDPRSDAAVAATAGLIRRLTNGQVARTEFSASTGGWTAGGTFPAVQDLGDAYAGNPNRLWTVNSSLADLTARLGVGQVRGLTVTSRNGLGADGGRVLTVAVTTDTGTQTLTGNDVRTRLGLKSDWFSLSTVPYDQAQAVSRAVFVDLLGRDPGNAGVTDQAAQVAAGQLASMVTFVAASRERGNGLVTAGYQAALHRAPAPAELAPWADYFTATGSQVALRTGIWASDEAYSVNGGTPETWISAFYRSVLGREAAPQEIAAWTAQLPTIGRQGVAFGVAASVEGRNRLLAGYYETMLGREPDPVGMAGFRDQLAGAGDITVPVTIAGSVEYAVRSLGRFPS